MDAVKIYEKIGKLFFDRLYNVKFFTIAISCFMLMTLLYMARDGIFAKYPSNYVGGYYLNFVIYQTVFLVSMNLSKSINGYADKDAIFIGFCVTVIVFGFWEVLCYVDSGVSRHPTPPSQGDGSVFQAWDMPSLIEKVASNFFNLVRIGFYISANIPLFYYYKLNRGIDQRINIIITYFIIIICLFALSEFYLSYLGYNYEYRFPIVAWIKMAIGIVYFVLILNKKT